ARGAHDRDELAAVDRERHAAQRMDREVARTVGPPDVLELDQGRRLGRLGPDHARPPRRSAAWPGGHGPTTTRSPSSSPLSTWAEMRSRTPMVTARCWTRPPAPTTCT